MYEYLVQNPVVSYIFMALILAGLVFLGVKQAQVIGLEKIRKVVYQGFIIAENEFLHGENTQKFEYVVQLAKNALPEKYRFFITEKSLREIIQLWFDLCKDLLDDGKIDGTAHKE